MNKYKEALNQIKNVQTHQDEFDTYDIECTYGNEVELLQELVDKEIPMKVKKFYSLVGDNYDNTCGSCDLLPVHKYYKYCPRCGQRLDWDDKDE